MICGRECGHLVDCELQRLGVFVLGNYVPRSSQFSVWTEGNVMQFMTLGNSR